MARIEGVPKSKGSFLVRLAYWRARRQFGRVPEPLTVVAHHAWLWKGYGAFELAIARSRLVDLRLKLLAQIKVAAVIGCPF